MKLFLVFFGDKYYPSGGFKDFKASFNSFESARDFLDMKEWDWAHIVESDTHTVHHIYPKENLYD